MKKLLITSVVLSVLLLGGCGNKVEYLEYFDYNAKNTTVTTGTAIIDRIEENDREDMDVIVAEFDGKMYDIEHPHVSYSRKLKHYENEKILVALVDDYLECMNCYEATLHELIIVSP